MQKKFEVNWGCQMESKIAPLIAYRDLPLAVLLVSNIVLCVKESAFGKKSENLQYIMQPVNQAKGIYRESQTYTRNRTDTKDHVWFNAVKFLPKFFLFHVRTYLHIFGANKKLGAYFYCLTFYV